MRNSKHKLQTMQASKLSTPFRCKHSVTSHSYYVHDASVMLMGTLSEQLVCIVNTALNF